MAAASGRASLVSTTRPSASSVSRSSPQRTVKMIGLAAVDHERHGLGRLAERDRQAAGGERIERAGVAGALRREQPLDDRDRVRRGHADRLVEHDPAVHVALVALFVRGLVRQRARAIRARRRRAHRGRFRPHANRPCCLLPASLVLLVCEVALDVGCSQKLLDPFRFVESFVDAKANFRSKFQVNATRDLAAHEALVALERRDHVCLRRGRRAA